MLKSKNISLLEKKFHQVADSFLNSDSTVNTTIELKRKHSLNVCREIITIARKLYLTDPELEIAYLIALFHDLGRFEQFAWYKTFNDKISINHAEIAVKTLKSDGFMDLIPPEWLELISTSILNHNLPEIKLLTDKKVIFFSKLLRDADKLDIWRIITDNELRRIVEGISEEKSYSIPDIIYDRYNSRKYVPIDMAVSINDMRMVRASWIFDINFKPTFKEIKKRKIVTHILNLLPDSDRLIEVKAIVEEFIDEKS